MDTSLHGRLLVPALSTAAMLLLAACQADKIQTPVK